MTVIHRTFRGKKFDFDNDLLYKKLPDFCYGCGTCVGICPNDAIVLNLDEALGVYHPEINLGQCKNCNLCIKTCPFFDLCNFRDAHELKLNDVLGDFTSLHLGYSTTKDIRTNSSSGGLVTSLLLFLLQNGAIDGAVLVNAKKNPLKPEPFIARTKEEIISAQGSKYVPIPLNIILKLLLKEDGRFAIVGLPCHIQGLRNAMEINDKLKSKIAFCLGLFCSFSVSIYGNRILLEKLNVDESEITEIRYRGRGWPGYLRIITNDGNQIECPYHNYWRLFGSFFFTPVGCLVCSDVTNIKADLSFGDAWLPNVKKRDKMGSSIIISRTEIGDTVLQAAISKNVIHVTSVSSLEVVRSQWSSIYFKKVGSSRVELLQQENTKTKTKILKQGIFRCNASLFPIVNNKLASSHFFKKLIKFFPLHFIYIYGLFPSILGFLWFKLWIRRLSQK